LAANPDIPGADAVLAFLRAHGAERLRHRNRRALLDHLLETAAIVHRWGQPVWLQRAALIHSVYGTERYHRRLLSLSKRAELAKIAGPREERLAFLFCATDRKLLLAGTHLWARDLPGPPATDVSGSGEDAPATRDELDALVVLHMANLADQAQAADGSPDRWLVRLRELAEHLIDSDAVCLPTFIAALATLSEADESLALRAYASGLRESDGLEARASRLALAAGVCPVVAEPCVWQAHLSRCRGDLAVASWWAQCAHKRLHELGAVWDKRLSFAEWSELTDALGQAANPQAPAPDASIAHPRELLEATRQIDRRVGAAGPAPDLDRLLGRAEATQRFHRYVEGFAHGDGVGAVYPDLELRSWYDASDFPLAGYVESHFEAIRDEVLALEPATFQRESERIERLGDWDVAFFYERGRRRDELCDACPVTARAIEAYPAMRTMTGLIYVSRMRPATHIRAHRGPTNLRVRCHLGIKVPDGDCALRVGTEIRRWQEGKCLVFNDYVEHEAWNHTGEDRLVLIVDMWHPGLSPVETSLLEGLHGFTYAHARKLARYWSANAAAAGQAKSAAS
jgi:aspartate beta-hydroxylase